MKKELKPLSQEELGIYLSCSEGGLMYNLPFMVEIKNYSSNDIKKAIKAIFESHSSLYTQIIKDQSGDLQKELVIETLNIPVKKNIDAFSWPKEFDLLNHPLYRFEIEEDKGKTILFCDFHHILMDGTSISIFLNELEENLKGKATAKKENEAFISGEIENKERSNKEKYESSKAFYIKTFGSIDCESLPVFDKKDEKLSYATIDYPLNVKVNKVSQFRKKNLIRTSSFFLGVYFKAISLFSGSDEAFFLTVNNGRETKNKDSLGMFVKSYPIYTKVPDEGTLRVS